MRIDTVKLAQLGFEVDYSKSEKSITIFPVEENTRARNITTELSDELGFNNMEHDELFATVGRLCTFNAIRRASGG